jgi:hypothetical protein
MDWLNDLLNLADAISAAVALVGFWYTWVLPPAPNTLALPEGASADELERFLRAAALGNRPVSRSPERGTAGGRVPGPTGSAA